LGREAEGGLASLSEKGLEDATLWQDGTSEDM